MKNEYTTVIILNNPEQASDITNPIRFLFERKLLSGEKKLHVLKEADSLLHILDNQIIESSLHYLQQDFEMTDMLSGGNIFEIMDAQRTIPADRCFIVARKMSCNNIGTKLEKFYHCKIPNRERLNAHFSQGDCIVFNAEEGTAELFRKGIMAGEVPAHPDLFPKY